VRLVGPRLHSERHHGWGLSRSSAAELDGLFSVCALDAAFRPRPNTSTGEWDATGRGGGARLPCPAEHVIVGYS
jgi:hypothetical protein